MAYYSGAANDMAALRSALIGACVAEGWTLTGDILSKGTMFCRTVIFNGSLQITGGTGIGAGSTLAGASSRSCHVLGTGNLAVTWPAAYEIFVFPTEVFLVVRFSVDRYQWCAFGQSDIALPGTGMWFAATAGMQASTGIALTVTSSSTVHPSGLPFWAAYNSDGPDNCRIHHGFDGAGWSSGSDLIGISYNASELISLLPNTWNSEAVLLPIRAFITRPSSKLSLALELINARFTRVDNHEPGEVITFGSERWKIFPGYRKDVVNRNGGTNIQHSGTFGWAVRYEGP
ncbi:hypothetical protein DBR00_06795 [Pseudomonas sp. HMWF032]|uniref:hypothetical protein n=1 Tax=Pseudomonas sp. HMWF032 TaxID=2056866 RepID=UPI000D370CE9|nr:hypothetical protein [Pseudomonas sp. HMWF032]PTS85480.1 hypothetical protein DBR00_06795 [Pseudomonas sp. HMWF032]PTT85862.1 hypothetical protein DBR41_02440 [Pseudomonas sp. HMWF010]